MEATMNEDARRKVGELIGDIHIAMLTTRDDEGRLHARPMAAMQRDFDGTLWFMTREGSPKIEEARQDSNVAVTYAHPGKQEYVSMQGRARIVRDKAKIRELWSEPARVWFPQGPDEPDIALLAVEVDSAEYWDSPSSAAVYLYGYAKARLTGKPPSSNEIGENKKVGF